MSNPIYTHSNYRLNLTRYWQQFYPLWKIPIGYHVHHIKPKSLFKDKDDPRMHHPRNLIALHPDDHISIHKLRGDSWLQGKFLLIAGMKPSAATRKKMSEAQSGTRNARYGVHVTDQIRLKMSKAHWYYKRAVLVCP